MLYITFLTQVHSQRRNAADSDVLEDLLQRIAEGDKKAFREFYDLTRASVYAFALSVLKSPHDAEDVMQDTYVKIYSAAGFYTAQGSPMSWLLTIVRNYCLMDIRKKKKSDPLPEDYDVSIEDHTGNTDNGAVVSAAMAVLGDEERQIVSLHVVSDLKHKEIAGLLAMPLSTVLSKYNRALKKMKKFLDEQEAAV